MQQLGKAKGTVKLKIETADDLWYLSHIIDPGDFVKGKTLRKIKKGSGEQAKQVKQSVFLKITAEKVDLSKNSLRVGGPVAEGPEDIAHGSWHTFTLEPGTLFSLEKERWLGYQKDKLKEACSAKALAILICVFDREEAYFALMKRYGYDILSKIKGTVQKKDVDEKVVSKFYVDIIKTLEEYDKRYGLERIILASPAFWKEELMKELKNADLKNKVVLATCSAVGKNGINEVLKRPETKEALKEERISRELKAVEELLAEISRQGKSSYGLQETEQAAFAGAVANLLVTDKLIHAMREKGEYEQLDALMTTVDKSKGVITIVSSEHEGGKKLDGLGGIGALLRYKLN